MHEGAKHLGLPLITHDQAAEVLHPGDGAFDFSAATIASKFAATLSFDTFIASVGAHQLDAPSSQPPTQGITVGGPVVNQSFGVLSRPTTTGSRHGDLLESRLDQRALMWRRRGKFDSERHTLAVCHHHKLRTL